MPGKPKLAIITNNLNALGGGERLSLEIASRVRDSFDVSVLNPVSRLDRATISTEELKGRFNLKGVELVDVNAWSFMARSFGSDRYVFRIPTPKGMATMMDAMRRCDVVYQTSLNPLTLFIAATAARSYGKKFVLGVHNFSVSKAIKGEGGAKQRALSAMFLKALGMVGYFHVTNTRDQGLLRQRFPKAHVELIYNFITRRARAQRTNRRDFIVFYAGRLESQKGVDLLCEAIAKTVERNDRIKFHIAGSGGDCEQLVRGTAHRYPRNVKWFGFVFGKRLEALYKGASLFVLPSRSETFSISLLEAQSYGMPALAFDVDGPKDMIRNGFQGELIPQFDVDGLVDGIVAQYNLWSAGRPFDANRRRIAAFVNRNYSPSVIIPKIKRLLMP
ncbi:MAG: glycosyltransferase [Candidatus Micrarchaeota archaeon]|nr:glycosyltransferase [Candidatus Micrarchaeota archaeon]